MALALTETYIEMGEVERANEILAKLKERKPVPYRHISHVSKAESFTDGTYTMVLIGVVWNTGVVTDRVGFSKLRPGDTHDFGIGLTLALWRALGGAIK